MRIHSAARLLGTAVGVWFCAAALPLYAQPETTGAAKPSSPGANAQAAGTVAVVDFVGRERSSETFVRDVARISVGDPVDTRLLDEAVARLTRTGRFLSVTYETRVEADGVHVTFQLKERVVVTAVRFEGASHFGESKLKEHVTLKLGDAVDLYAARDGRDGIAAAYREDGYSEAEVTFDQAKFQQSGELVYQIREGVQVRIRTIRFEGNHAFDARQLSGNIETKTAFWIFRTGAFDQDRAEGDVGRIRNHYQDEGFLDAKCSFRKELAANGTDLTVVFTVDEGTRYVVEDVQIRGNSVLTTEELQEAMRSRVGETVKRPQVDADVKAIRDRYGALGYIYVEAKATRVFSESPGAVRITIEVKEGDRFKVGRVVVRGNARTKDKVVRRALDLYPPDDVFNLVEAREAEKRLTETRIFSSAKVVPVGDQPGVRDAVIDVKEAEKSGDFLFGFGVTSNSGLLGSVVLDLQNFDIFDKPKSLEELFKFRSYFGGGQRMRIELQPGTEVSRFRVDFTEPYFLDKPLRFDLGVFLFSRGRDGYDERRIGSTVAFGKRFEKGALEGWAGEVAARIEDVNIDEVDVFAARRIREVEGSNFENSLKGSLVRDRTDNRFLPSKGDRLKLAYEQFGALGGDHVFGRLTTEYNWFTTLHTDRLDRKHVLELRGEGGVIVGDAPVFERFYAGGIGSIRGFEFRGVGEREGIDRNNVGGDYLILGGAEYSYPLYGELLRGHVFLDTGTAGSGSYRAAVGTGVRLTLDFFGPLPLEFNLGIPVLKAGEDDDQVFSFLIGRVF